MHCAAYMVLHALIAVAGLSVFDQSNIVCYNT
jgi:hypothetical protein